MSVTIKQIAKMSGVHRSTVDKVLHNREGVSDEVRARVKNIIEKLDYKPNIIGKALKCQKQPFVLAVLLLKNDALNDMKLGIEKAYNEYKDFGLKIEYSISSNMEEQLDAINQLKEKEISGVIISPFDEIKIRDAVDKLVDEGIPVITTNTDLSGSKRMCFIGQDVLRAGKVAAELMGEILNGQGKVAVITGSPTILALYKRLEGFLTLINSEYPGIEIVDVLETYEQSQIVYQKTLSLLETVDDLRGIFITAGRVSEVGEAVKKMKKDKKIKIICFDLYPKIVEMVKEGLINFAIGQDLFAQGYIPLKILFEYLFYNKKPETDIIKTTIDIRIKQNIDSI